MEQRVLGRNVTGLVLPRGACHWKIGEMGRTNGPEVIPFAVLKLEIGRKGPNFRQARGFLHWNARKSRGVLILTENRGAQKVGRRRGRSDRG